MVDQSDSVPEGARGSTAPAEAPAVKKVLTPAAQRALAEAAERRAAAQDLTMEKELGGRKEGPEPTRYGDWESKGLISDF